MIPRGLNGNSLDEKYLYVPVERLFEFHGLKDGLIPVSQPINYCDKMIGKKVPYRPWKNDILHESHEKQIAQLAIVSTGFVPALISRFGVFAN